MSLQKPLTNFRLNKNVIVVKVYFIFENLLAILRNNVQEIVVYSLKEEEKKGKYYNLSSFSLICKLNGV